MDNNLEQIVAALRQIQDDGGDSNFVVFTADPLKNYYIQFVGELAHDSLFGEAVSNEFLEPPHTLTAAQEARLRELGWKVGEGNFYQEWFASDDEERQEVAETVMQTFVDVYHISPTQPIEIIVNLE
jgi:hypothetical protein